MTAAKLLVCCFTSAALIQAQGLVSIRVLLGITDTESTTWDGSVQAGGASVASIEPWRFEGADKISGSSWKMSTHPIRLFNRGTQYTPAGIANVVANGAIVRLSRASADTTLKFTTAQGNFDVRLSEIPYGNAVYRLNGRVYADQVPSTTRITESPDEEDYPASGVDRQGGVWIAYISFRHHPDHNRLRAALSRALTDFEPLKALSGGDQVFARRYANGNWEAPIEITPSGYDLYRPAIAIDGKGRIWVFSSRNVQGNFDLYARPVENGKPGKELQITKERGSDVFPVATTDSGGNVWVAWQGWRNGRASILAARQNADSFSAPEVVSQSARNEWNPAIAADKTGRVAIAWDSYRNGNYDVYTRTFVAGRWQAEKPVAATPNYEAYPSIAYDRSGRLWVAFEEGGSGWGKDFGAYDTNGVALYQGRLIRVRGFESDGRAVELPADVGSVLPGIPDIRADHVGVQNEKFSITPDPQSARRRDPNRPAENQQNPKNTMPRLLIDGSDRIWLAFRSAHPVWWNPIGTAWTEHVVSFDGSQWTHPIFLTHTDNLLDNRPALASTRGGELIAIGSSDGRREFPVPERYGPTTNSEPAPAKDPFNNDLYANTIDLGSGKEKIPVVAAKAAPGAPPLEDQRESAALKQVRAYRVQNLRIVRGEFHRHSEVSMDGGFDGSLLDQWRYILDTASLDWVGCCDHDNGGGREYSWWTAQKLTDIFYTPGSFSPMFNYERSVAYPEGHRNVIFAQRGIRTLPRLPKMGDDSSGHAPDTQMLYAYLKHFNGIVASHTSGTNMGTDWRDNDPSVEPVVEIYQGDRQNYEMPDAPRSNSEKDSIGGWRPKGFVNLALQKGYRLGFQASSDHVSTHLSYCNILVTDTTREAVLDGLRSRHVYGSTDNIVADVRSGSHLMGDAFSTSSRPTLQVKLVGTSNFARVQVIKDNAYVYSTEPNSTQVSFTWRDDAATSGQTSYYYVRGEQKDGQIVWVSPMWITYQPGK
jgi:hypothetical protein